MTQMPIGTVTFLFTDIEGSTRVWEEHSSAMQVALARHDAILRESIEGNGGYVFKTVGDAFYAAFASAPAALRAAVAAQRALQAERWPSGSSIRVRMSLHTGLAESRDGDYFGPPLNRVARLLSAGYGGQILVSDATHGLLRDNLPLSVDLLDLGEHTLKDLQQPGRIYQVTANDLLADFPPLKTLSSKPTNLPLQTTPFIGRTKEIEEVSALLSRPTVRLLTLTGPGGTGKSRLALQAAAELIDSFDDGVFFVPLAPISDPTLVASAIAQALGVRETGRQTLLDSLKYYLRDKNLLLLLDNFEQVMPAAATLTELLLAAPSLKALVTSRTLLHLSGEHDFAVPPLSVPNPKRLPPLAQLAECEAVRLFIDRATALKPDFRLDHNNAPTVAEICYHLDGLPLAIELAAARIRLLPPQAMLSRLASRLKLLTGGASDLPARQQTLRNTIEWSHDLLDERDRLLFRRLSVFVGGCTLEAAEAVCAGAPDPEHPASAASPEVVKRGGVMLQMSPIPAPQPRLPLEIDVLDGVQSLLDNSLLQQQEVGSGVARVAMLETIREYAQERLAESGEIDSLQRRHALFFLDMAEQAESELRGPRQVEWLGRLESEHDNFRAALRWAEESGEAETGLRLAAALARFWFSHGHLSEGRTHLESALGYASAQPAPLRAKAFYMAGRLAMIQGDYEAARSRYEQGLTLFKELGDRQGSANVLNDMGNVLNLQGDYAGSRALKEESLELFRAIGDNSGIASALLQLGNVLIVQGDLTTARAYVEESLQMLRRLGDVRGIAMSLFFLGNADLEEGLYAPARAHYDEGLKLFRELGDKWTAAALLVNLGKAVSAQEDYFTAQSIFQESRETFQDLGTRRGIADSLAGLADVAHRRGDQDRAHSLFRQSLEIRRDLGDKLGIIECLEGLARVAIALSLLSRAASLFGAASAHRAAIKSPLPPGDQAQYERNLRTVRTAMTEEDWLSAWAKGEALLLNEAVALALHDAP